MIFDLYHRSGRYTSKHGYANKWDFTVEGKTVQAGNIRIEAIGQGYNGDVQLGLADIPERIDIASDGTIWLHDEHEAAIFPEPYHSLTEQTSQAVWNKHSSSKLIASYTVRPNGKEYEMATRKCSACGTLYEDGERHDYEQCYKDCEDRVNRARHALNEAWDALSIAEARRQAQREGIIK